MGVLETLLGYVGKISPSWFFPRLTVGVEGEAQLCTGSHPLVYTDYTPSRGPAHIDVTLRLWNKGAAPITAFGVLLARAGEQDVFPEETGYLWSFEEATLEPGGHRSEQVFFLRTKDPLAAKVGDRVEFKVRLSKGRPLRVRMPLVG